MKPTCSVNIAPPIAANDGGDAEREDLEIRDAVAGEPDAILLVAHRHQDAPELGVADELRDEDAAEQAARTSTKYSTILAWSVRMSQPCSVRRSVMPLMPPV